MGAICPHFFLPKAASLIEFMEMSDVLLKHNRYGILKAYNPL